MFPPRPSFFLSRHVTRYVNDLFFTFLSEGNEINNKKYAGLKTCNIWLLDNHVSFYICKIQTNLF